MVLLDLCSWALFRGPTAGDAVETFAKIGRNVVAQPVMSLSDFRAQSPREVPLASFPLTFTSVGLIMSTFSTECNDTILWVEISLPSRPLLLVQHSYKWLPESR